MTASQKPFDQQKRRLFIALFVPVFLWLIFCSQTAWEADLLICEIAEITGLLLIFLGVLGRCWSILYIGDKKNKQLVRAGPYRYTRNPLYFFSALGMLGVGLAAESVILAGLFFCFTWLSFMFVAKMEASTLRSRFGEEYDSYCNSTPAFFPSLTANEDFIEPDEITFSQKALRKTFLDASFFLLMIPLLELREWTQDVGWAVPMFFLF